MDHRADGFRRGGLDPRPARPEHPAAAADEHIGDTNWGEFTETIGLTASFVVWTIFGALFVGELFTHELSWRPIVYALLSLTVIRMVPVALTR